MPGNIAALSIIAAMADLTESLPRAIYSAGQVRELDRIAVAEHGIPSYTLMTRAAEAALRTLRAHWPARNQAPDLLRRRQ